MFADLMNNFPVDSTYSESPSLPPELYADVMPLSGLAFNMGFTP